MEEWRPIKDWPEYHCSRSGTVLGKAGRPMRPGRAGKGHLQVYFCRDGIRSRPKFVHRLIYETFVGEIPNGMMICHRDDNPENNRLENLYCGTALDNRRDMVANMRVRTRLTEAIVHEIRRLPQHVSMNYREMGEYFGVSQQLIGQVLRRQIWKHI